MLRALSQRAKGSTRLLSNSSLAFKPCDGYVVVLGISRFWKFFLLYIRVEVEMHCASGTSYTEAGLNARCCSKTGKRFSVIEG